MAAPRVKLALFGIVSAECLNQKSPCPEEREEQSKGFSCSVYEIHYLTYLLPRKTINIYGFPIGNIRSDLPMVRASFRRFLVDFGIDYF